MQQFVLLLLLLKVKLRGTELGKVSGPAGLAALNGMLCEFSCFGTACRSAVPELSVSVTTTGAVVLACRTACMRETR